jgi:hypothetical protein
MENHKSVNGFFCVSFAVIFCQWSGISGAYCHRVTTPQRQNATMGALLLVMNKKVQEYNLLDYNAV